MQEIKKAIITFHYAEKIKSELIVTISLLESLGSMKDEEIVGAQKLVSTYLNVLIREVNIAKNVSSVEGFREVSSKLEEVAALVEQHDYSGAIKVVSEAISITTTNGNEAAKTLQEKNLI